MKAKIFITFALVFLTTTESFARIMACDDSTGRRVLFLIEDYSLIPGKTSNIRVRMSNSFRGNNSVNIPQGDYFASFKKVDTDTLLVSVKNHKFYTHENDCDDFYARDWNDGFAQTKSNLQTILVSDII